MSLEIIKLNLEGEICPYTLIKTLKKVKELKEEIEKGKVLSIITDHHPAVENIPMEMRKRGFNIEYCKFGSKWKIKIKK